MISETVKFLCNLEDNIYDILILCLKRSSFNACNSVLNSQVVEIWRLKITGLCDCTSFVNIL